jgi:hypothetical protein
VARFNLPERLKASLLTLAGCSPEQVGQLYDHLKSMDVAMLDTRFTRQIASELNQWEKEKAERVVEALVTLCSFHARTHESKDELVANVIEAVQQSTPADKFSPEVEGNLRERITRFLDLSALDVSAKAAGVLTDHQRVFTMARILSDVRAVFPEDASLGPAAAVIDHMLKITFIEDGATATFFVALDSADLAIISKTVERAKKKDEALRKLIAAAKLPLLEPR